MKKTAWYKPVLFADRLDFKLVAIIFVGQPVLL